MADSSVKSDEQLNHKTDGINEAMEENSTAVSQDIGENPKQQNDKSNNVNDEPLAGTANNNQKKDKSSENQNHKMDEELMEGSVSNKDLIDLLPSTSSESPKDITDLSEPMEEGACTSAASLQNYTSEEAVTSGSKGTYLNNGQANITIRYSQSKCVYR